MEPLTPAKRLITLLSALVLIGATSALAYRQIVRISHVHLGKTNVPTLDLIVKFRDTNNEDLDAADSVIASDEAAPVGDDQCPTLSGGDIGSPTTASASQQRPANCPKLAVWYVKKRPIAFTLYFNQGKTFLQWWDKQPQIKPLVENRLVKGLFFGLLQSLKIKAEQLNLQGIQGELLGQLLRDAIAANAELHYDLAHGHQGWVLSYLLSESDFAQQALPVMSKFLAGSAYRLTKLPEPILEMRIGLQHFYLTEYQERLYLSQSLEALLNVIESVKPLETADAAPLSLHFRAEAIIDNLLPVLSGAPNWEATFNFDLKDDRLGSLKLPNGPWLKPLHDKIFEGVLASIPHDAFAAVATSFQLSPTLTVEDWKKFAEEGPAATATGSAPGGLGVVWDFDAASPAGAIGIIVANSATPQAAQAYRQYLRTADLSSECAGGSLFLTATSSSLLTRMKEACALQSLSVLDWQRGSEKQRLLSGQLFAFINPGVGIRELFLAGGAGKGKDETEYEFAPRWQQDYEKAKAAMRTDGDKLFNSLPILSYAGRVDGDTVSLEGRAVNQGVTQ